MVRKIGKNGRVLLTAIIGILALVCMGCGGGGDEILSKALDSYDAVVCFQVRDGAFKNIGTGGTAYSAEAYGGNFTESFGREVYDTGGTKTGGTWRVPWSSSSWSGTWDRYVDIGYVDLGTECGDLLATSDEWTIETMFAFPDSYNGSRKWSDMVDLYVWSFNDNTPFPAEMLGFCSRVTFVRLNTMQSEVEPGAASVNNGNPYSRDIAPPDKKVYDDSSTFRIPDFFGVNADTFRTGMSGTWTHLVVTKASDGTVSVYVNGDKTGWERGNTDMHGTTALANYTFPTWQAGDLVENYLGKTPYPVGGDNGDYDGADTYGSNLINTRYYHFAIDDKAWDDDEVYKRYSDSPIGKGLLIYW